MNSSPIRTSLVSVCVALLMPALASAATPPAGPPKKLVCQLGAEGITVEATFDGKNELRSDVKVFRQSRGQPQQMAQLAKDEVDTIVDKDHLQLVVDRVVDGNFRRVLFLSWSPAQTSLEVLPSSIIAASPKGEPLPVRVRQDNLPCTLWR